MRRFSLFLAFLLILLSGCGSVENTSTIEPDGEEIIESENPESLKVEIGDKTFTAELDDNEATKEFINILEEGPLTVEMSDYSGFEKVGDLGRTLPTEDLSITTAEGDVMLYDSDKIVLFYGPNTWEYTKIGKITDLEGLREALGNGDVTVVFSLAN